MTPEEHAARVEYYSRPLLKSPEEAQAAAEFLSRKVSAGPRLHPGVVAVVEASVDWEQAMAAAGSVGASVSDLQAAVAQVEKTRLRISAAVRALPPGWKDGAGEDAAAPASSGDGAAPAEEVADLPSLLSPESERFARDYRPSWAVPESLIPDMLAEIDRLRGKLADGAAPPQETAAEVIGRLSQKSWAERNAGRRPELPEFYTVPIDATPAGDARPDDAAVLRDTLELIDAHGCSKFTGPGRCLDEDYSGLTRISTTGTADQWCDPCRARDALNRAGSGALDPDGVERAAIVLSGNTGSPEHWVLIPEGIATYYRNQAEDVVRAYLAGETDDEQEG